MGTPSHLKIWESIPTASVRYLNGHMRNRDINNGVLFNDKLEYLENVLDTHFDEQKDQGLVII